MTRPVCAILDDYQGVALTMADWSAVESRADLRGCASGSPPRTRWSRPWATARSSWRCGNARRFGASAARAAAAPAAAGDDRHAQRRHRHGGGAGPRHHRVRHGQPDRTAGGADLGAAARARQARGARTRRVPQPSGPWQSTVGADLAGPAARAAGPRQDRQPRGARRAWRSGWTSWPGARTSRGSAPRRRACGWRRRRPTLLETSDYRLDPPRAELRGRAACSGATTCGA